MLFYNIHSFIKITFVSRAIAFVGRKLKQCPSILRAADVSRNTFLEGFSAAKKSPGFNRPGLCLLLWDEDILQLIDNLIAT